MKSIPEPKYEKTLEYELYARLVDMHHNCCQQNCIAGKLLAFNSKKSFGYFPFFLPY